MPRYFVLISDPLAEMMTAERGVAMPDGFRLLERREAQHVTGAIGPPNMHWWLVEDDKADDSWEEQRVELQISSGPSGPPYISSRRLSG